MTRPSLNFAVANLAALALASGLLVTGSAKAQGRPFPALAGGPAMAQPFPTSGQTVRVDLSGPTGAARSLALPRGKSAVIELPVDAHDVLVSDPKVANVVLSTPRRIYVMGVAAGETDAVFVDGSGRQILRLNVRVDQDVTALGQTLNRILPGSTVRAEAVNDSIILSGEVPSASDADKAIRIASTFVGKPEQIVNMLSVAQPEQVMLKVRIVEVNRQVIKQLGVNLGAVISKVGNGAIDVTTQATYGIQGTLAGGVSAALTNTASQGVDGALGAFERVGLIRSLAEPNLTAVSGESAQFLAGGEFPVPSGTALTASVEYKSFGVGLGFTPVVLSKGRISLKLSTEYSQLTSVGALTVAGSSGTTNTSTTGTTATTTAATTTTTTATPSTTYPALTVRRASTVVELPSGGSMMIAGLLQSVTQQDIDSLPGLMQLPVLGALFRSRDFQQQETELVVIVTPYLVHSTSPDLLQTPADGLVMADDLSTVFMGQMNKAFNKPVAPVGKTYQGPVGYVVE
ncbi:MAG: type II and III secretion system protein family protein [Caulobacteraceae bacterium]